MRLAPPIALVSAALFACDTGAEPNVAAAELQVGEPAPASAPHAFEHAIAPRAVPSDRVTFGPAHDLGDARCVAVAEAAGTPIALAVRGELGVLELVRPATGARELIGPIASEPVRVTACALSLDWRGRPEIVVATLGGTLGRTLHLKQHGATWLRTDVAAFAARHLAFNARSPRGSEVLASDFAEGRLHAHLVDGHWRPRALPAVAPTGPLALAVAVDEHGRSHFALGADYYGDRGDDYALWPGARPADHAPPTAVAIVLDPIDPDHTPRIVHAQREPIPNLDGAFATHLYHTVIGPAGSSTVLWSRAAAITGLSEHLAPDAGQLAARLDEDGYLHTIATSLRQRASGATWGLVYTHDRLGEPRSDAVQARATGSVHFLGEAAILVSAHGELERYQRTSDLPAAEPAEPPSPPGGVTGDR